MLPEIKELIKNAVKNNPERILQLIIEENIGIECIETKNTYDGSVIYFKANDRFYSVETVSDSFGDMQGYDVDSIKEVVPKTKTIIQYEFV